MPQNYQTTCTTSDGGVMARNSYERLESAFEEANRDLENPIIVDHIIIDTANKIVQLMKGNIDPFLCGLNKQLPGWENGIITNP